LDSIGPRHAPISSRPISRAKLSPYCAAISAWLAETRRESAKDSPSGGTASGAGARAAQAPTYPAQSHRRVAARGEGMHEPARRRAKPARPGRSVETAQLRLPRLARGAAQVLGEEQDLLDEALSDDRIVVGQAVARALPRSVDRPYHARMGSSPRPGPGHGVSCATSRRSAPAPAVAIAMAALAVTGPAGCGGDDGADAEGAGLSSSAWDSGADARDAADGAPDGSTGGSAGKVGDAGGAAGKAGSDGGAGEAGGGGHGGSAASAGTAGSAGKGGTAGAAGADVGCRSETFLLANNPAAGTHTLRNCSNSSVGDVNNVLSNSDAHRLSLLRSSDLYLANKEWIAWVDQTTFPGVLRGLWPIDAASNAFIEPELGGALKSFVQVHQGFFAAGDPTPWGYAGLHVEIWRKLGDGFYTYPASAPGGTALDVQHDQVVASYATTLVDVANGQPGYIDPVTSAAAHLLLFIAYYLAPDQLDIGTAVGASIDGIHVNGHAGGLLLLLNRACSPAVDPGTGHYKACSAQAVRDRSLHVARFRDGVVVQQNPSFPNAVQVSASPPVYDLFASGKESFAPDEDRYVATFGNDAPWVLQPKLGGSVPPLCVDPDWGDPIEPSQGFMAYHYNDGRLGITGFGSLDIVAAPKGPSIVLGPGSAAQLRFWARLHRRQVP
jgi:hypothetical protein